MKELLAIILAGGRGKRMSILCHERPKPLLPFAGRCRVIDFSLSNCVHSGIRNIAVLTDYQRINLADYLDRWHSKNNYSGSFHILEPGFGNYKNTADAVYQNLDYLRKSRCNTVLILPADHVYKMDYRKMLASHEQMRADLTIGVVSVPIDQAYRFGNIILGAEGRVTAYIEKPDAPQSNLVSMGIFLFDKRILIERLIEDSVRTHDAYGFERAIIPGMLSTGKVFAYRFHDYWKDIGNPKTYLEANMMLTQDKPTLSLGGAWPILSGENDSSLSKQPEQAAVSKSIVSPGCVIKGRVENSVLSPDVWIDEKAVVCNSVLMANTYVGYHSVVDHCVVDEMVKIDKFSYVGFGVNDLAAMRDVTVLGKHVIVPPYTAIGRNCTILPEVVPLDFATNAIPSGMVVSPQGLRPGEAKIDSALMIG